MEKEKNTKWHEKEIDVLKKYYPFVTREEMTKLLPGRSYSAIRAKASKLKINKIGQVDKMEDFLREVFLDK